MEPNPYEGPKHQDTPEPYEPWPYWNYVALGGFALAVVSNRVRFAILGEFWGQPTGPIMNGLIVCSTAGIPIGIMLLIVGAVGWFRAWLDDDS